MIAGSQHLNLLCRCLRGLTEGGLQTGEMYKCQVKNYFSKMKVCRDDKS